MTEELSEAIEQIRKLSPKLNTVTDQADAVLVQIEKFLNEECSIGIPGEVCISDTPVESTDGGEERWCSKSLVYERVEGRYRTAIKSVTCTRDHDGDIREEPDDVIPWPRCPRNEKLAAFNSLPSLLQDIAKKATAAVKNTEKATATLESIVNAIK